MSSSAISRYTEILKGVMGDPIVKVDESSPVGTAEHEEVKPEGVVEPENIIQPPHHGVQPDNAVQPESVTTISSVLRPGAAAFFPSTAVGVLPLSNNFSDWSKGFPK